MKKLIKKYGNAHIILLNSDDMKIYELKEGDIVEIHIRKLKKEDIEDDAV